MMEKGPLLRQEKKFKGPNSLKKVPKSPEFFESEEEEEGPSKDDKGEKMSPLLGV